MHAMHILLHACIEVRVVSHITVGFITQPGVIDTINVDFVLKPTVMCLPPIKRNQEYTHARTLTSLLFLSFTYSHFSLFSLYVVMVPGYFNAGIYMFLSLTL